MNNEPVAWMHTTICSWVSTFIHPETQPEEWIPLYTHPVKELTDEDRSMLIRTLKWSEDLLRIAGHDEAVSDVQDCIMLLRKAQKK